MKIFCWLFLSGIMIIVGATTASADWSIDIEGGAAFSGYNDVRIPGDVGTDISLTDDLDAETVGYFRARLTVDISQRQRLSVLVAPLRIDATGAVNRVVDYNGVQFAAGERLNARYRFDSYRLSYSYALVQSDRLRFDLGFTAKVRDAAIRIAGETEISEKTNTGFVPLINFSLDWSFSDSVGLLLKGDALAAPQGRAEDVLLALYADATDRLRLRLGYRILEGGADNDEVYNFALVNYVAAGITWTF
ncbi:hypothetical protein GF377_01335 [candidate division GN15 bacterium]|nr:hypothetical protein [candidate division GN15 bacterium]